ncbi:Hypothetical predicted protein [Cloeon dipterum]|uniref:Uncharacterized protein n=1 Tax=Cloeon dipterum TaxID=197152 RepID=A0A8S1DMY1_9INSE|nr:Hypothetical predicted protein [Cloeon dipterum]
MANFTFSRKFLFWFIAIMICIGLVYLWSSYSVRREGWEGQIPPLPGPDYPEDTINDDLPLYSEPTLFI